MNKTHTHTETKLSSEMARSCMKKHQILSKTIIGLKRAQRLMRYSGREMAKQYGLWSLWGYDAEPAST